MGSKPQDSISLSRVECYRELLTTFATSMFCERFWVFGKCRGKNKSLQVGGLPTTNIVLTT